MSTAEKRAGPECPCCKYPNCGHNHTQERRPHLLDIEGQTCLKCGLDIDPLSDTDCPKGEPLPQPSPPPTITTSKGAPPAAHSFGLSQNVLCTTDEPEPSLPRAAPLTVPLAWAEGCLEAVIQHAQTLLKSLPERVAPEPAQLSIAIETLKKIKNGEFNEREAREAANEALDRIIFVRVQPAPATEKAEKQ